MSAMATVFAGTMLLAVLLLMPVWLQRRIRRRIEEQTTETAPRSVASVASAPRRAEVAPISGVVVVDPVTPPAVPLHVLLKGMTLPCELAPLTNVEPLPTATVDRLVFVTEWPADRVRADLKGAFAAVEFDLTWTTWNDGIATGAGVGFRVVVHPAPDAVMVGARPAFPTARSGTTVVELAAP
jgi:hypothetical protein